MKKLVVFSQFGTVLDAVKGPKRWERWRPTLSILQHQDLVVDRLELLVDRYFAGKGRGFLDDLSQVSPETEVRTHEMSFGDPWSFEKVFSGLHQFARDYPFDPDHEEYLLHITTGTHVFQICLFLLTEARYFPGKLLQTSPPHRKDRHLPGTYRIIDLDLSQYDLIASRFRKEREEGAAFLKSGIETRNRAFNQLIDRIEQVAISSREPLLLMGPTGAGKSQLARRIYELKLRRRQVKGAFVDVNCATLRGDAAMSALFGHVRGAFTGALTDRPGLLRAADQGLLFLDEISELGLDEQAMLLRALEEKRFMPVGSDREVGSDFQLIAGTNRDPWQGVRQGRFREDLLARINLWTFDLPALRERPEDIEPNLRYELDKFTRQEGRMVTFNKEAITRFLAFAEGPQGLWRANFRDLNAAITRMATLAPGGRITPHQVGEEIQRLKKQWESEEDRFSILERYLQPEMRAELDLFEKVQLAETLWVCESSRNLARAGRELFAASRKRKTSGNDSDRLRKYLAKYGITPSFHARARLPS